MNDDILGPHKHALDQYQVPPLPAGFSDRLIARLASENNAPSSAALLNQPVSWLRNRATRTLGPWGRSGRILTAIAALSLASATAAAAGFLGEPTYVPVISQVLASTNLVADPRAKSTRAQPPAQSPARKIVAANQPEALTIDTTPETRVAPAQGTTAVINRLQNLKENAAYNALPPRERLVLARRTVFAMVRSGEVTQEEAGIALKEMAENSDPATKARQARRKAAREVILERNAREDAASGKSETNEASPQSRAAAFRERMRKASPEERAVFWRAVRERQQANQTGNAE
jgi:hypothetical protein